MLKKILITCSIILALYCTSYCTPARATVAFRVSSPFGWRIHPITGKWQFHTGTDIPAPYGAGITALFDGEVVWAEAHQGYGNTVLLRHINNTYTLYGHCARLYVQRGQVVKAGEWIAAVGSTGVSTGPHLHLEYWVNNRYVNPMTLWQTEKSRVDNDERGLNQ